jgi:ABC-2 type transport system permease protein
MTCMLRAEWTKARTLPATIWLLAAVLGATVAVSALAVTSARHGADADPVKTSLTGVYLSQVVAAVLGSSASSRSATSTAPG